MKTLKERFEDKYEVVTESGCWLWTSCLYPNDYGYLKCKDKSKLAHRISYEIYKGELKPEEIVRHTCDVRCCVNPNHLIAGTQKDNMQDMYTKGRRIQTGIHNHMAKLTEKEVREIRSKYKLGSVTLEQLGNEYNVNFRTISQIVNYKRWKDI